MSASRTRKRIINKNDKEQVTQSTSQKKTKTENRLANDNESSRFITSRLREHRKFSSGNKETATDDTAQDHLLLTTPERKTCVASAETKNTTVIRGNIDSRAIGSSVRTLLADSTVIDGDIANNAIQYLGPHTPEILQNTLEQTRPRRQTPRSSQKRELSDQSGPSVGRTLFSTEEKRTLTSSTANSSGLRVIGGGSAVTLSAGGDLTIFGPLVDSDNKHHSAPLMSSFDEAKQIEETLRETENTLIWSQELDVVTKEFAGRKDELDKLKTKLKNKQHCVIIGMSGIGKSRLAKEYAKTNRNDYKIIWFFNSELDLHTQFSNLLNKLIRKKLYIRSQNNEAKNLVEEIQDFFTTVEHNWLLIFDNFNEEQVKNFLVRGQNAKYAHIIITSINQAWTGLEKLEISILDDNASVKLMQAIIGNKKTASSDNLKYLANTLLGNLPLALVQAASFIEQSGKSIESYCSEFNKRKSKWTTLVDYAPHIDIVFSISLEEIERKCKISVKVFDYCAYLSNVAIPKDLIKELVPSVDLDTLIIIAQNYSIFEKNGDSNFISIHKLMHRAMYERSQKMQSFFQCRNKRLSSRIILKNSFDQITNQLTNKMGGNSNKFVDQMKIYAHHIMALVEPANNFNYKEINLGLLFQAICHEMIDKANYSTSQMLLKYIVFSLENKNSIFYPYFLFELASIAGTLKEYTNCRGYYDKCIVEINKLLEKKGTSDKAKANLVLLYKILPHHLRVMCSYELVIASNSEEENIENEYEKLIKRCPETDVNSVVSVLNKLPDPFNLKDYLEIAGPKWLLIHKFELMQGVSKYNKGKFDHAITYFKGMLENYKHVRTDPRYILAGGLLGLILYMRKAENDLDLAYQYGTNAIKEYERYCADDIFCLTIMRVCMGFLADDLRDFDNTMYYLQLAETAALSKYKQHEVVRRILKDTSNKFRKWDGPTTTADNYTKMINLCLKLYDKDHLEMASLYNKRGMAYLEIGDIIRAKEDLDNALRIAKNKLKSDNKNLLFIQSNINQLNHQLAVSKFHNINEEKSEPNQSDEESVTMSDQSSSMNDRHNKQYNMTSVNFLSGVGRYSIWTRPSVVIGLTVTALLAGTIFVGRRY